MHNADELSQFFCFFIYAPCISYAQFVFLAAYQVTNRMRIFPDCHQGFDKVIGDGDAERLEVPVGCVQPLLQLYDPFSGIEANTQLIDVERLVNVVVRSGFHSGDQIFFLVLRRQQDEIGVGFRQFFPDFPAYFNTIDARHIPVEDGELRGIWGIKELPGFISIRCNDHIVSPFGQYISQEMAESRFVFSNQYSHDFSLSFYLCQRAK